MLPEQATNALDAFRAPLSSIRDADLVVVIGDDPVEERAPVVDLWIKAAQRNGREIVTVGALGLDPGRAGNGRRGGSTAARRFDPRRQAVRC